MIELKPSKRIASPFLGYFASVLYLVIAFLIGFLAYSIKYNKELSTSLFVTVSCAVLIILSFLFIISNCFSWYKSATLSKINNCIVLEVEEIVGVLGRNKTIYKLDDIAKLERKGSNLIVRGCIRVLEPMSREKIVAYVKIHDITEDAYNFLARNVKNTK